METALIVSLWLVTVIFVLASLLPLSRLPHGVVRGLEFPREQIFVLALLAAGIMAFWYGGTPGLLGACVLGAVAVIQLIYILKFTPIWRKQSVAAADGLQSQTDRHVTLLAANVKKSNRDYGKLIDLARERDSDIMMAIEVDEEWIDALKDGLEEVYPHWVEVPLETGYGLCLMSRLELQDTEVRELITEGVPSIRTTVKLRSGDSLRLYVVHPEPPVIDHDTKGRDSEIAQIGMEAEKDPLPAIVTGDLNDVAWSTTTRRFQRLSGLLDPRVGRGFYNTFSATMPWMRWPLDHLFHDPRFRLLGMERLPKIGSDHFPMWFALALAESEAVELDPGDADPEEESETREMIREEKSRDREAIGSHWEDD
jgi:endonuclease/exonuclease/phosphatase (EEP) superfamily protein YafD